MSDVTHFLELNHGQGILYMIVAVFAAVALIKAFAYLAEKFGLKTGAQIREEEQDKDIAILKERQGKICTNLDEIKTSITTLSSAVNKIQTDNAHNEMKRKRRQILDFADGIADGRTPSKESVDDILELYDEYEAYIHDNKLTNGRMDMAIQFIRHYYNVRFLQKEE